MKELDTIFSQFDKNRDTISLYIYKSVYFRREDHILIQVENLVKRYGVHTAVDDLSFTVNKGQIYGFLGPNGAGKSTTMNIMTGYIAASSGTVKVCGHDILKEPEDAKKCIGYLPEIPPLYTDMTVWEYLMFAAELKKVPKSGRIDHVEEIVQKLQLEDVEDRLIKNISKGYKQRVGLAQALIGYPEVLILDEPMVGLDPKQIIEMRDLIKSFAHDHTIILSSHILSEVSAVCDHIMIISRGKLVASGSPEELQGMMQAKAELDITVLGTGEQVDNVLQGMEEVESYEIEESQESGAVRVRIDAADDANIRKELSLALSGAGLPILSMNRLEKSLEDIFLELTESEQTEDEIAEEESEKEESEEEPEKEDSEEMEKEEPDDDSNL